MTTPGKTIDSAISTPQITMTSAAWAYEIKTDSAMDAVTQLLARYRALNPGAKKASFDFADGSKITISVKKPKR
jgi:hypothetical protein